MSASTVSIDPKFFPHVWDGILNNLDIEHLFPPRQVCTCLRDAVDPKLAKHIVVAPNHESASEDNPTLPWLPTSPLRRFPKNDFWTTDLKNDVAIVDLAQDYPRVEPYPTMLSQLNVDTMRSFGGDFRGIPLPTTREWILGMEQQAPVAIPRVVTERIVLVLKTGPGFRQLIETPADPLELVVILDIDGWADRHCHRCSSSKRRQRELALPSYGCNCACKPCRSAFGGAYNLIRELAILTAYRGRHFSSSGESAVILVDAHQCFHNLSPGALSVGQGVFLDKVEEYMEEQEDGIDLTEHVKFMTRGEYRDHVGAERFKLYTEVGYARS